MEASEALEAIHNANLIHRDITPKNIMITEGGSIKLMDFGISRSQFEERTIVTSHGKLLGSEPYMSPEQLDYEKAKAELGPKSDIYSLGSTFYELFSRTRIYNHNNDVISIATASNMKRRGERPKAPNQLNKNISWEISTILMGCLENDQADRYISAQKLKNDINNYLNDRSIEYKRPSLRRRMQLTYKRNKFVINLSAVFIAMIIISTTFYINSVIAANTKLLNQIAETETQRDLANKNGDEAKKNSVEAQTQAGIAKDNEAKARVNADEANKQKKEAEHQAEIAMENEVLARDNADRATRQKDIAMGMINKLTYDIAPRLYSIPNAKPMLSEMMIWNTDNINKMLNLEPNSPEGYKAKIINYYLIGDIWKQLNNYDKAIEAYENGQAIAQNLAQDANNNEAMLQSAIGNNYIAYMELQKGELQKATLICNKGLNIARKLVGKEKTNQALQQLAACYDYLGNINMQENNIANAVGIFEKEVEIRKEQIKLNNNILVQSELAKLYGNLGQAKQQLPDLDGADKCYQESIILCKEIANYNITPDVKRNLEEIYTDIPYLATYALDDIQRNLALAYSNMGSIWVDKGDSKNALENYNQALTILNELAKDNSNVSAQSDLITCCLNIAEIKYTNDDINGALEMYQRVLDIRKELIKAKNDAQAQSDLALSYIAVGNLKQQKGDLNGALEAYSAELEIEKVLAQDTNNILAQKNLANCYTNIGNINESKRDNNAAFEMYKLGKETYEQLPQEYRDNALLYNRIAFFEETQEQYDQAISDFDKCMEILTQFEQKNQDVHYSKALVNLSYANISMQLKKPQEAIVYCDKAIELGRNDPDINALAKSKMAVAFAEDGNYLRAETLVKEVGNNIIHLSVHSKLKKPIIRENATAYVIVPDLIEDLKDYGISNESLDRLFVLCNTMISN